MGSKIRALWRLVCGARNGAIVMANDLAAASRSISYVLHANICRKPQPPKILFIKTQGIW